MLNIQENTSPITTTATNITIMSNIAFSIILIAFMLFSSLYVFGRDGEIRTHGLYIPNVAS